METKELNEMKEPVQYVLERLNKRPFRHFCRDNKHIEIERDNNNFKLRLNHEFYIDKKSEERQYRLFLDVVSDTYLQSDIYDLKSASFVYGHNPENLFDHRGSYVRESSFGIRNLNNGNLICQTNLPDPATGQREHDLIYNLQELNQLGFKFGNISSGKHFPNRGPEFEFQYYTIENDCNFMKVNPYPLLDNLSSREVIKAGRNRNIASDEGRLSHIFDIFGRLKGKIEYS